MGGGGSRLSVIMTLTVGNMICESPLTEGVDEKVAEGVDERIEQFVGGCIPVVPLINSIILFTEKLSSH